MSYGDTHKLESMPSPFKMINPITINIQLMLFWKIPTSYIFFCVFFPSSSFSWSPWVSHLVKETVKGTQGIVLSIKAPPHKHIISLSRLRPCSQRDRCVSETIMEHGGIWVSPEMTESLPSPNPCLLHHGFLSRYNPHSPTEGPRWRFKDGG